MKAYVPKPVTRTAVRTPNRCTNVTLRETGVLANGDAAPHFHPNISHTTSAESTRDKTWNTSVLTTRLFSSLLQLKDVLQNFCTVSWACIFTTGWFPWLPTSRAPRGRACVRTASVVRCCVCCSVHSSTPTQNLFLDGSFLYFFSQQKLSKVAQTSHGAYHKASLCLENGSSLTGFALTQTSVER